MRSKGRVVHCVLRHAEKFALRGPSSSLHSAAGGGDPEDCPQRAAQFIALCGGVGGSRSLPPMGRAVHCTLRRRVEIQKFALRGPSTSLHSVAGCGDPEVGPQRAKQFTALCGVGRRSRSLLSEGQALHCTLWRAKRAPSRLTTSMSFYTYSLCLNILSLCLNILWWSGVTEAWWALAKHKGLAQ